MRFERSEGLTPSERVLANLCDNSFLKLWTYPNLYRNVAKELTDLLVVCGNDVIIFSDKSCGYPNSGDPALDWSRWYRRSISKSVHQIDQAERWLRNNPDRVYLDARCTKPLPITLPPPEKMRIHRVCIALGAAERALADTGRQGLAIKPLVLNDAEPFTIGRTEPSREWVHVFDEESLAVVLRELSTITDFVHYLSSKTAMCESGHFIFAESELDILGYYLWHNRTCPTVDHAFRLEANLWQKLESDLAFLRGREENEISYFWDRLIEYLTNHYLGETLEAGNDLEVGEYERLARIMAGETRFFRRILAKAILERAERARRNAIGTLLPSGQSDVIYVLFIGRGDQGGDHASYRAARAAELKSRCIAAKAVRPDVRYVIGIALDALGVKGRSEDFILIDTQDWTLEQIEKAEELRQLAGHFIDGRTILNRVHEQEYPT
ncbi:hypothetical protein [Sinorhizobium fredii]|uniref:hypothetical protein n=1 Tax=Rhizobium fredii TaxID=380 RepID=UPI0004B48DC1|nr:hypothetical protein [Sinorhizobium fredii]